MKEKLLQVLSWPAREERLKWQGRFPQGDVHHLAGKYCLCSPSGRIFRFQNLFEFVRSNESLFDPKDVVWRKRKDGCYICKAISGLQTISPRAASRGLSWKGWTRLELAIGRSAERTISNTPDAAKAPLRAIARPLHGGCANDQRTETP